MILLHTSDSNPVYIGLYLLFQKFFDHKNIYLVSYQLIQKIAVKLVSNREPNITLFQPNHVNFLGRGLLLGTQALMVILNSDGPIATGHSRTINPAPNWNFGNLPHKTLFHIFMASVTNPCDRTTRIPPPPPSSSENSKA